MANTDLGRPNRRIRAGSTKRASKAPKHIGSWFARNRVCAAESLALALEACSAYRNGRMGPAHMAASFSQLQGWRTRCAAPKGDWFTALLSKKTHASKLGTYPFYVPFLKTRWARRKKRHHHAHRQTVWPSPERECSHNPVRILLEVE